MARKTTTVVNCDNPTCRNYAEVEDLKHTPSEWYRIAQADERGGTQVTTGTFDLCSLRCIEKWSKERRLGLKSINGNGGNGAENKGLVLLAVQSLQDPSSRMIQEETGLSQNTVDKYLRELEAEGTVTGQGEANNPRNPRTFHAQEDAA
jgi:hypothetical protein